MPRSLFIDPGLTGTGYAVFEDNVYNCCGVRVSKERDWQEKAADLSYDFDRLLKQYTPESAVIEFPSLWVTSSKSFASAQSGDIFKLVYLIGMFGQRYRHFTGENPKLISPNEWKGQLPKNVVIARIKRQLGFAPPNHAADAVGMGLACLGKL